MIAKERNIRKLKRINYFLIFIILSLFYWIRLKYDREEFLLSENKTYFYELLEKDEKIKEITSDLDSIKKQNSKPVETQRIKNKINIPKKEKLPIIVKDTVIDIDNKEGNFAQDTL